MPFPRISFANSNAKAEKVFGRQKAISREIQFGLTTWTWCSWCPSHILIIPGCFQDDRTGEGQGKEWAGNPPPKQFTEHDECILLRIAHFHPRFFSHFSLPRKSDLWRWILIFNLHWKRKNESIEQRGKTAREWNNQHNRSFNLFIFLSPSLSLTLALFKHFISFLLRFFRFRFCRGW